MKKYFLLLSFCLVGIASLLAQFQLRPIMVRLSPVTGYLSDVKPGVKSWNDKSYGDIEALSPTSVGMGIGVYVPVLRPLWLGFSFNNAAYYNYCDSYDWSSKTENDITTSVSTKYSYQIDKLNTFSMGLQYRPGSLNKRLSCYFNLFYTMQTLKIKGNTEEREINIWNNSTYENTREYQTYENNNKLAYNSSGITFGLGLDLRVSQHVLLNIIEVNGSSLSGSNNHTFNFIAKTGVSILFLKKK